MQSFDIRRKYLKFFEDRGHAIVPAAPIVPPDDPTTLFTSSGMQQMVPYLKGEKHPMGVRIVDSQPSFRSDDIEEVGDNRHICMFEMLGNWSLGDYFKDEQLPWFYQFVTQEVGLNPDRLYVSVFEGDEYASRDDDAIAIWQRVFGNQNPAKKGSDGFDPETRIYMYPAKKNWWSRAGVPANMPPGEIGGPDSEMFYDFGAELQLHENSVWKDELCHVNCDCGRFMEIGNSVFMQFEKQESGSFKPLPKQNVDFGGGLERLTAASNGDPDVFKIDMFAPIIKTIEEHTGKKYLGNESPMRVIVDHLRAATFMMAEGLEPSNKMQGYVLRRLLRRAAVKAHELGGDARVIFGSSIPVVISEYARAGFINADQVDHVLTITDDELTKFGKALGRGLKKIEKVAPHNITPQFVFDLFQSSGFPFEVSAELAAKKGVSINKDEYDTIFAKHKEGSRTASAGMFKGGLADHSETTTKYHTATHLLHQALADVLGDEIQQAGSNITSERLRFDYRYSGKPTAAQLKKIESIINEKIAEDLPVKKTIEDKNKALESGARAFFAEKYPDKVSVYSIGNYSRELCGGPHVERTGLIGQITIYKDEALGSGTRRIYARLR